MSFDEAVADFIKHTSSPPAWPYPPYEEWMLGLCPPDLFSVQFYEAMKRIHTCYTVAEASQVGESTSAASEVPLPQQLDSSNTGMLDAEPNAADLLMLDAFHEATGPPVSPWVSGAGLSEAGRLLLERGLDGMEPDKVRVRDDAGNTVMHFLAARKPVLDILLALRRNEALCNMVAREVNTGGQTFLHLLRLDNVMGSHVQDAVPDHVLDAMPDDMLGLIPDDDRRDTMLVGNSILRDFLIRVCAIDVDLYALDKYGRSFFHKLYTNQVDPTVLDYILEHSDASRFQRRDAFGIVPVWRSHDVDEPARRMHQPTHHCGPERCRVPQSDCRLLQHVIASLEAPSLEYEVGGGNGLHSLAAVSDAALIRPWVRDWLGEEMTAINRIACTALHSPKVLIRYRLAALLMRAGVDTGHYDESGHTPLMAFAAREPGTALRLCTPDIVHLLIRSGADVHARNREGETALLMAARGGNLLAVRTLVTAASNVHARDADGRGVLQLLDMKIAGCGRDSHAYARYEACRAWLSGVAGAVHGPSSVDE